MNNQWTQIVIFMAAVVSGVLNFDGLSELATNADWWLKTLFAMTAIVVTFSLSLFWQYAFGIVPELSLGLFRARGWGTVLAGMTVIIALSTYWNVVSLARGELNRLSDNAVIEAAQAQYTSALNAINGYNGYVADISAFREDLKTLQDQEIGGSSSGQTGTGPVSNTFGQIAGRLKTLTDSINLVSAKIAALQTLASSCLADLRGAMDAGDREAASTAVSCINQSLTQMTGLDPASAIKRSLINLTSGVVLPANVRTQAQRDAIKRFMVEAQSRASTISKGIAVPAGSKINKTISLDRPNVMKAVLIYWQSLIPPIATALAIDLLPLVLLVFASLRHDDQSARDKPRKVWTASELQDALIQINHLDKQFQDSHNILDLPDFIDVTPSTSTGGLGEAGTEESRHDEGIFSTHQAAEGRGKNS